MPGNGNDIRIRIGVAVDANASAVMAPIEQGVKRVRRTVEAEMRAAMKAAEKEAKQGTTSQERSWRKLEQEVERMANQELKARERADKASVKSAERAAREKEAIVRRSSEMAGRYAEKQARDEARAQRNAQRLIERERAKNAKAMPWYAKDIGSGSGGAIGIGRRAGIRVSRGAAAAYGYGGAAVSGVAGIGREILGGLGVDSSLGSMVNKGQQQQSLATQISNSGNVPGTQVVKPADILAEARAVGNATGTDTTEALKALQDFVSKTGDLETARGTIKDLAVLSRATGTNLADMADAAAEVSNNLGDIPNKAGTTAAIMKQIAGSGKLGAVEIKDLATQMAKLGAAASRFSGGAEKNIPLMGVLAQEAKLRGGAASASQASTAVTAFAGDFAQKSNVKNWKARGLTPFADEAHSILSDPKSLILAALKNASGKGGEGKANQEIMKTLFPSKQGYKAVAGFTDIYNEAGGGQKGAEAVEAEFKRLTDAALGNEEIQRAFAASMKTSEASVTVFNNKMAEVAESLTGAVLPAFEQSAPKIVAFASSLANVLANATGVTGDKADDDANNVVTNFDKDRGLLEGTAVVEHGEGSGPNGTKVYSQEEHDVVEHNAAKLITPMSELEAKIQREKEEAEGHHNAGNALRVASFGVTDGGEEDKAKALEAQAAKDMAQLEMLKGEFRQYNELLRMIRDGQRDQTIVLRSLKPVAPPAAGGGRAPANADTDSD